MKGDVSELVESGRLAPLFCRLARDHFTGVVYAEREDGGAVFSFRDGRVVFAEDLGDGQTIPDMLLERGLVNAKQYAEIATCVIDSLADNEDVAFCEHAVRLRVLSQAQVDGGCAGASSKPSAGRAAGSSSTRTRTRLREF
jgi:hypothetical protein